LCLLPFEPEALNRLGGPPGTFVGHRLSSDPNLLAAASAQVSRRPPAQGETVRLLVLPGSRKSEVRSLIEPFASTIAVLKARGARMKLLLPTVPHVAELLRSAVSGWPEVPEIIVDPADKWRAFGEADAAMIASGTVSLELALTGVPMVSCYKLDPVARLAMRLITVWSAALPNLIADRVVLQEYYNELVRPEHIARQIEALWHDTAARAWQLDGFAEVRRRMATDRSAGAIGAEVVMGYVDARRR